MTVARSFPSSAPADHALAEQPAPTQLLTLLQLARQRQASDVHWHSGQVPWLRVMGELSPLNSETAQNWVLAAEPMQRLLRAVLSPSLWTRFDDGLEVDAAWSWPGLGRYRVNVFRHESGCGMVMRCIGDTVPSLDDLRVPTGLLPLLSGSGLILVTGPTGSGKSTTLAAMLHHLNVHRASHILTLEDPIEYLHPCMRSLVTQREIGRDSPSFAHALRAALREDPDVLLVGEMRDLETIRLALTAAETGHLVLASLHSRHAAGAIDRIIDVFEATEKALIRTQLAEALRGVVAQTLYPRADGSGRCALFELLVATPAVRNLIRENKTPQIASAMQIGGSHGMVTFAQARHDALQKGHIPPV